MKFETPADSRRQRRQTRYRTSGGRGDGGSRPAVKVALTVVVVEIAEAAADLVMAPAER